MLVADIDRRAHPEEKPWDYPRLIDLTNSSPPHVPSPWYCVISITTLRLLYLGKDESAARSVANPDVVLARADNPGEAQVQAALESGKVRRQRQKSGHGERFR